MAHVYIVRYTAADGVAHKVPITLDRPLLDARQAIVDALAAKDIKDISLISYISAPINHGIRESHRNGALEELTKAAHRLDKVVGGPGSYYGTVDHLLYPYFAWSREAARYGATRTQIELAKLDGVTA